MNELNIIGKALGDLELKQSENGTKYATMLLQVKKPYKNKNGEFDYDTIQMTMFNNCAEEAKDIISDGAELLVRGHINANNYNKEGKIIYASNIIADRINEVSNLF